jgi:hypothetical protein
MKNLIIIEGTNNVEHPIHGLNIREKRIAQTFALRGAFNEPCNIGHLEVSRIHRRRLQEIAEEILWVIVSARDVL